MRSRSAHRRVRRLPAGLLQPDPGTLPALHHLPAGHGGPRQGLRPPGHEGRHGRCPGRDRPGRAAGRNRDGRRLVLLRPGPRDCARAAGGYQREDGAGAPQEEAWAAQDIDLHVPAGQTHRAGRGDRCRKVDLAKLVARFYDPQRGRVLVDGHDLRDLRQRALRASARHRAAGGLPVLRQRPREHRLRPARRQPRGDRSGRGGGGGERVHRGAAGRHRHAGRRAGRFSSQPASASSSRSPGRFSPSPGSSSWTRRRRTSTFAPRRSSSAASSACWQVARRS